jgi:thiol:disulfide interchange protein/DsbC/DsbD-like thiol-disulfide interchange protein
MGVYMALAVLVLVAPHAVSAPPSATSPSATFPSAPSDTSDASPHSDASLATSVTGIAPGETFTVALDIEMEEGWHTYWMNPGDSGEPLTIEWDLPNGFTAGAIQWPFPHRYDAQVLTSYAYSDRVLLPVEMHAPDDLPVGETVTLTGEAEWLICAEVCLPASGTVQRTFAVGESPVSAPRQEARRVHSFQNQVPVDAPSWQMQASQSTGSYALAFTRADGPVPDVGSGSSGKNGEVQFFPDDADILDHTAAQPLARQDNAYVLALQASPYASSPVDTLRGVLVAEEGTSWIPGESVRAIRVEAPVREDGSETLAILDGAALGSTSTGAISGVSLPWALLFAFGGGLLLNLMPCVFPVLSIKILGFADSSGEDPSAMRRHGWLFGAGVLVSMWILAGTLLGLRAAGSEIGWGFQLQSPSFVALMALLFVGIGFNLLGAFEVGTSAMNWGGKVQSSAPSDGNRGAFMTGILATVVATPCTAPFMGAALGVALTSSTAGALAIFSMLGIGMATPYVALSMTPRFLDALPKPGAWMETLKQFFAFPMFATAIWLLWVFAQQTGDGAVALLLGAVLLLGMAAWVLNRWSAALSRTARIVSRTVVTAMVLGAISLAVIGAQNPAPTSGTSPSTSDAAWISYSATTVDSLRAAGRPVFIDFTAAWCITCQVNKRTVLSTPAVTNAFEANNVALVRADWTHRDAEITRALESHGRSGVPLYVYYENENASPDLLPEVLTKDIVLRRMEGGSPQ